MPHSAAEQQAQAEAEKQARKEAERQAHREAVEAASRRIKEDPDVFQGTIRTIYRDDVAISKTKLRTGRTTDRPQRQYSLSGEDVGLQGDPQAIQKIRFQAASRASERKQREGGGTVTQADINRETRRIMAETGGRVQVTDQEAADQATRTGYEQFKEGYQAPGTKEDEFVYFNPDPLNPYDIKKVPKEIGSSITETHPLGFTKRFTLTGEDTLSVEDITVRPKAAEQGIGLSKNPAEAFAAPFENIGRTVYGGYGALVSEDIRKDLQQPGFFKPEVEGALIGDMFSFGEKRFAGENVRLEPSLMDFGAKVSREPPASVAASVAGSAILFAPGLVIKGATSLRNIGRASLPKFSTAEIVPVRTETFKAIQKARPDTSIYKYWPNYEKAPELKGIGKSFDLEYPVKSGAVSIDEVTLVKEFERAPFGRFVSESRPKVLGQRTPLTIEEELELVRLNPSKPRKLPTMAQIAKPDITEPFKTSGAPFKFASQEGLPKLGDIMKANLWKPETNEWIFRSQGEPAMLQKILPYKQDIVKKGGYEWVFRSQGEPELLQKQLPFKQDIVKKGDYGWVFRSEGEPALLKPRLAKYGDLFPDLFKARKPKGDRPLSEKELGDLFETLEGKKEIGFARDYLTRSEQGRLAGDLTEDFFKLAKKVKKTSEEKAAEDLLKSFRSKKKEKPPEPGSLAEIPASGERKQSSVILGKPARRRSKDILVITDVGPTPKGFGGPSFGFGFGGKRESGLMPSLFSNVKGLETSKVFEDNIKALTGGRRGSRSLFDIGNVKELQLSTKPFQMGKLDTGSLFSLKPRTAQVTEQDMGSLFDLDSALTFDIPGMTTPTSPLPDFPALELPGFTQGRVTKEITRTPPLRPPPFDLGFGEPKRRKGKKRKLKVVRKTAGIMDALSATVGYDTALGKFANRMGNPEFFGRRGRKKG